MKCYFCEAIPAGYAVITGATADERGELERAKYRWACADCAKKSLIDLIRLVGGSDRL